ncbi:DUF2239 family protein [Variovorax sp. J22P271]|uniref:DUF2239 family protein n=1 Tax=Variovorax davisae TaxID=3053515 RepID=UPI002577A406|nr:DUF2239 family protein [Variovorax sp. J22P271]MDM0035548.1 DUF2239 family protein [Variovorax sp. J22P271]
MSSDAAPVNLIVFADLKRIAQGRTPDVLAQLRERTDDRPFLVFDEQTGDLLDFDVHHRAGAMTPAASAPARAETPRGVGRPKLGVVAREVTLLPRHWDWLNRQPGGASVALRRLVQDASRVNAERDAVRASREATYRFMTAIAGALPGFEEAARALFAGDQARFGELIGPWPGDVVEQLRRLSASAWSEA